MTKKAAAGIIMTLLLISMFTTAFNIPLKLLGINVTTSLNDNAARLAADEEDSPFSLSSYGKSWDFNRAPEWVNSAKVDNDSIEMIIGIGYAKPNSYEQLRKLITENQGELVNTVSMNSELIAAVVDIPLVMISPFAEDVRTSGLSRYVEPNLKFQTSFVPNDPYWSQQWGPVKIEADHAWNTTTGAPSVLVAIIDTGIDYDHPDLAANYVSLGYDWVNNDSNPMDDNGHGTHCAGIIAAIINNGVGVAGLAQVRVMAEKCLNDKGGGYASWIADAIIHAVDQGADILSLSLGGYADSNLVREAVVYAYEHDVLVVAAAGNDAADILLFPAYYEEVIAVTATNKSDDSADFTTFGDWVELAAPGVDIFSTIWNNSYDYMSGTSMACPHVSGVAALVMSRYPQMSRDQVRLQLRRTADDLGKADFDVYYGYGRVNARRSIEESPSMHDLHIWEWKRPPYVEPGDTESFNVTMLNFGFSDENFIMVQLLVNGNIVDSALINSLSSGATTTVNLSWNPLTEERYNVTAHVIPVSGENYTLNNLKSAYINVRPGKSIRIPLDCAKIEEAVELARPEEVVQVASGTYYEHVHIDKSVKLIGENCDTTIIDANETGCGITILAEKVYVDGFTMQNSVKNGMFTGGAILIGAKDCVIVNNRLINNYEGVAMIACNSNITVSNNLIDGYHDAGVGAVYDLGNNSICKNTIINPLHNSTGGIMLVGTISAPPLTSDNNIVRCNTVISHMRHQCGVLLALSYSNLLVGNTLMTNEIGIFMGNCKNNTVEYNNITNNYWGIKETNGIFGGVNTFHHNNMINNTIQAESPVHPTDPYYNTWDCGYPSGGNYWSDYYGTDLYNGLYQNETGSDGIGDTPYIIDGKNQDEYPFMTQNGWENYPITVRSNVTITSKIVTSSALHLNVSGSTGFIGYINATMPMGLNKTEIKVSIDSAELIPPPFPIITSNGTHYFVYFEFTLSTHEVTIRYAIGNIAIANVMPCKTVVGQGYSMNIAIAIENQGDFEETFNVTAYYNNSAIVLPDGKNYATITLTSLSSTTVTLTWNTTGVAKGNYTIGAYVHPILGEADIGDNAVTDGMVQIVIPGDVNADKIVDTFDLVLVAGSFGSIGGELNYDPNADINNDNIIDIFDLVIIAIHYGETW